ncbi:MAG TPA: glycoside hydrolase family 44 protein [Thermoanaerobaculia bacterium]
MFDRIRNVLAFSLILSLTTQPLLAGGPRAVPNANPAITVNVDAAANQHPIDPRIYGSSWATAAQITSLGLTLNRWGGNAMSRYNWAFSTANRCKDYFFYNIPDPVSSGDGSNGKSADDFISLTFGAGAHPVMTIPMLSLLPKDRSKRCSFPQTLYPNQEAFSNPAWEPFVCGNGRYPDGNPNEDGPRILGAPDPNNISTSYPLSHQGNWVQHMIDTFGSAAAGGVRYFSLDNEPGLWSFDHWDVHPTGTSYNEVWAKMSELGALIRQKEPAAVITAGEEWGWSGYFMSGLDIENGNNADRNAHGGKPYYDWLLDQAKAYEQSTGVRIIDVWTAHYYPQAGEFWSGDTSTAMQNLRNRSTRSLWDPNYVDESWIGGTEVGGAKVRLIPRLKEWVANHYPGTQIGITEYNWGVDDHINGGTTQADILGIFGREGVDMAVRWGTPDVNSFAARAFQMYRNYDGNGAKFGNTSVSATAPNVDEVSAFASVRSSDGALTVMLVVKTLTGDTPTTVNLANFTAGQTIQRWQFDSTKTITRRADLNPAGSTIALTLPAQSVTLLVIPPAAIPAAPALTATATGTAQVALSWNAVAGALSYDVYRSFNNAPFALLANTGGTTLNDNAVSANTTYLYQVRAVLTGGSTAFSAIDPATTIVFTDSPLTIGTPIKAAHFTQLRTAVNAMRAAAGLSAQSFTDPVLSSAVPIKTAHLTELRTALDAARATIGLPAAVYTNGTTVKAAHVTELRNGVK